jgi:hypothetical protein
MKSLILLLILSFSTWASAEVCTNAIKDNYSGYEYEYFTRSSYSQEDACFQAGYDCRNALSYYQSQGRNYSSSCIQVSPLPNPNPNPPDQNLVCRTDLLDQFGNIIRQFTAMGKNALEACIQSDLFCKFELNRRNTYGSRCENRGIINRPNPNPYPRPQPPREVRECFVSRLDPAGYFVQRYLGRAEGPQGTDVLGMACREAMNYCQRELVGRQYCQYDRR